MDAKELMGQGWKARENLEFDKAEQLLTQAKDLFEKSEDWFNVTECLNHLAYNEKLRARERLNRGLEFLKEARGISSQKQTKDVLILRAEMSLFEAKGSFEEALLVAQKLLEKSEKPNVRADVLSHMSTFVLRLGRIDAAQKLISDAESLMNESNEMEKEPFRSIWLCRILLAKALISYNKNEMTEAKQLAEKALKIAEEKDLKTRIQQAKEVLELLSSKA